MNQAEIKKAKTLLAHLTDRTDTIIDGVYGGQLITAHWLGGGQTLFYALDSLVECLDDIARDERYGCICETPPHRTPNTRNSIMQDQNGHQVAKNVKLEDAGWGVTVQEVVCWMPCPRPTHTERYHYRTQATARKACISDDIGRHGRIA